jgi:GntR family transcriptional repressor for pyruvate dehydrogenase complex
VAAQSLTERVADDLSGYIARGQLKQGDPLPSEDDLASMFSVSKRVIREALRTLAAQGIIETSQGKRAVIAGLRPVAMEAYIRFMRTLDSNAVAELYELRSAVEIEAAALAARRASSGEIGQMSAALEAMRAAGDDVDSYVAGDLAFHKALVAASHNRFFSWIMDALHDAMWEERSIGVRNRARVGEGTEATFRAHREVLEAIEAKDPVLAAQQMSSHLQRSLSFFRTSPVAEPGEPTDDGDPRDRHG